LDLLSLALLLPRLAEVYRRPEVAGAAPGAIARFLIRRGRTEAAHAILGRNEAALNDGDRLLLAWTARRCGDSARAVKIWSSLAARRNPLALEALAKYHEHALDDCRTAARLAALLPAGARRQRRLERLNRKLAGPGKEVGGCRGM